MTEVVDGLQDEQRDSGDDEVKTTSPARAFFDWLLVIGIAVLVALLVKTFFLAHFIVEGDSMYDTLHDQDRVFVNKMSYRLHDPNRGDVVVLHEDAGSERDLIKRVIALPGETIQIKDCDVYIDGFRLEEPYLSDEVRQSEAWCTHPLEEVGENEVFVLGDNRPSSADSRRFGPVSQDDLVGRAFVVFWPTADMQWL